MSKSGEGWQTKTKKRKPRREKDIENTERHYNFDPKRYNSSGRSGCRSASLSYSRFKNQAFESVEPNDASKRRNQSSDRLNERKREKHDEPHERARKKYMGYRQLETLSMKSPSEILQELANSHSGFEELLVCKKHSFDQMYLIMKVLSKVCHADFERLVGNVLARACVPDFVDSLRLFLSTLPTEERSFRIEKMDLFFENLLTFFQAVLKILPRAAVDVLNNLLRFTGITMKNVRELLDINISDEYFTKLQIMQDDVKTLIEESKRNNESKKGKERNQIFPEPLDSIKDISLYPEPNDIHLKPPPIRPNIVHGSYTNSKHYLDVQFRLLREDFISPLRKGIMDFVHKSSDIKGKKYNNIRIYKRVRFLKTKITIDKVGYIICFDVNSTMRNMNWEFTKRFMYGSLLLFTEDNFETFFMGTVINRDLAELKKKQITVQLVSVHSGYDDNLLNRDYLMAESEVYFEPYFHVLRALQNMDKNNFPLEKYIVNVQTHIDEPLYLRNGLDLYEIKLKYDVRSFHILDNRFWPHWEQLCLDESQYHAFKAALTNELAVIQGPPGTGKTYIGLKIVETLLKNKIVWNQPQEVPILVVCYTNHALDQFLEGILNCTTNVIRIGGQSKNESLEPFNLKNRRRYYGYERGQSALMYDLKKRMSTILNNIKSLQNNLDNIEDHEGIVSLKFLSNILTKREKSFFNNNTNLIEWLLEEVKNTITKSSIDLIDEEYTFNDISENMDVLDIDDDPENLLRMQAVYVDTFDINNMGDKTDFAKLSFACTIQNVEKRYHELVDKVTDMINSQKPKRSDFRFDELKKTRKTVDDLQEILGYLKLKLNNRDTVKENDKIQLNACKDIKTLPYKDRWILYKLWLDRLKLWYKDQIRRQEMLYRNDGLNFEEARQMEDLKVLKVADVVGITTTTAAKFQAMLSALQPKIVIVEEAAEVLEAHIVASLTSHCKHLVLIGDHKQLRPNPADYTVGKDLQLEISLFERLINNGIECYTLNIQHRMRPEISTLLVPTIYPKLLDHPCVHQRDKIRGIDKNVFFIMHESPEQEIVEISSKQNKHEADFLIALCRHLLLQGYRPEDITILTTYSGQLYYLRNEKKKHNLPHELCIRVVDNFQGEESKIILLSLVRSNSENKVGFLKTENRVCVALSRARDGLYIIGNMKCLTAASELWQKIRDKLTAQGSLGPYLTLRCEIHPDHLTRVSTASDFYKVSEGGCGQLCSQLLDCGHICKSLCHVINKTHDLYTCREPCLRKCKNGHPCRLQCYIDCRKCDVLVERTLPCGHVKEVPCYVNTENYVCRVDVEVNFEPCKHVRKLPCYQRDTAECPAVCEFRLNCGHACEQQCHVNDDPDHLEYVCVKPCARLRKGCSTAHYCRLSCCEDCEPCKEIVLRELSCKHQVKLQCEADVSQYKCSVKVVKTVPECGHKVTVKCSEKPTREHCNSECQFILSCGHKCSKKCSKKCNPADCTEGVIVESNLICGHRCAFVPCNLQTKCNKFSRYCMEECKEMLDCKHRCRGTCGQCLQGRIHKACEEDCGKVLICGHSCTVPCNMICPPCGKPCTQKCVHSVCPRKCGEICAPCNESCTYNCAHYKCTKRCSEICDRPRCYEPCKKKLRCSHQCVGFCGEPCPPCKECEPQFYEIFFGTEDDDDARFVKLEECGHVFESAGLEHWFAETPDNREIVQKTCPLCKTDVVRTQRFMDMIKPVMKTIVEVKELFIGKQKEIHEQREQLKMKLKEKNFLMTPNYTRFPGYSEDSDELCVLYTKLQDDLSLIKNNRRNEIGIEKTRLFGFMAHFVCTIIDKYEKCWKKLNEGSKLKIFSKTNVLVSLLQEKKIKISVQEVNSFVLELNRLMAYIDLKTIVSTPGFDYCIKSNSDAQRAFIEAGKNIRNIKKFGDDANSVVTKNLNALSKLVGSSNIVTDEEKKMIRDAMAKYCYRRTTVGHFFKCGNGHIYIITECGGAMQQSRCPVNGCGLVIGGQGNMLAEGQQLASEMDGARYPAWPPGNDMNNFQL